MQNFQRSDRLAEQIRRDVSSLLEIELRDKSFGLVTFTSVRLTKDLKYATIYYSTYGKEEERDKVKNWLLHQTGRIRSQVGKNLKIHHVPEFSFEFDPSIEEGMKIERLLNEVRTPRES